MRAFLLICACFTVALCIHDEAFAQRSRDTLLWGPYRSNLYTGIRPRIPESFQSGLMWFNADSLEGLKGVKHSAEQGNAGYGWVKYDPRAGGKHVVPEEHVDVETSFVKRGESWALKVSGHAKNPDSVTSVVFYAAMEHPEGHLILRNAKMPHGYSGELALSGISPNMGKFDMIIDAPLGNRHPEAVHQETDPSKTHHLSLNVPAEELFQTQEIFFTLLSESFESLQDKNVPVSNVVVMRDLHNYEGNLHFVQKIFKGDFEFHVVFNAGDDVINPQDVDEMVEETLANFDSKFSETFNVDEKHTEFAQSFLSNLLGGIGYFYGQSLVDRETVFDEESFRKIDLKGKPEGPFELFTCVPSRAFFPRGFYWDEGFHLLQVMEFDFDLSWEIMASWMSLIDEDGWIAREQILGMEARKAVPQEFQTQNPNIANPPTLLLALSEMLDRATRESLDTPDSMLLENSELILEATRELYPNLARHYEWFRRTQRGMLEEFDREAEMDEAYRWIGRTFTHCLPSGLDDYPRAQPPDLAELNVDLLSWVGVMTRSMKKIATILNMHDEAERYSNVEQAIIHNLDLIHWSDDEKSYCDVSVDDEDESIHVCHKGYITVMPFSLKLISKSSPNLKYIIDDLADPEKLFSPYGIRSLSKQDEEFGTAENYWRSPVWMNMNYVILDALQHYFVDPEVDAATVEKARTLYTELRHNLINNVYNNWKETGFAFENYNEATGKGQGVKHFYGWTALIVNILNMPESLV